jgi:hypothetical protein
MNDDSNYCKYNINYCSVKTHFILFKIKNDAKTIIYTDFLRKGRIGLKY